MVVNNEEIPTVDLSDLEVSFDKDPWQSKVFLLDKKNGKRLLYIETGMTLHPGDTVTISGKITIT